MVELDASLRDDPNVPQVAVELIIVEPVPDDEAVGDTEATVPGHDGGVPAASSRLGRPRAALAVDALLQQRADLDRPAPAPLSQDREEAGEGDASVDDVLHHDHVPPLEAPVVEVLRHPDGARGLRPSYDDALRKSKVYPWLRSCSLLSISWKKMLAPLRTQTRCGLLPA